MTPPGIPQVPVQYACTTDEGDTFFFDGDVPQLFRAKSIVTRARIALPQGAITSDGTISVQKAMALGGATPRNIFTGKRKRNLTTTGHKTVLVIRVVSNDYAPSQSEAKMSNDIFDDENNLVSGKAQ